MSKKYNILIIALIVLGLASVTYSFAFLTKSISADNVITFGDVKIKLHETYINEYNQEVPVDTKTNEDILKASKFARFAKIENLGKHPVFVRLSLNITSEDVDNSKIISESLCSINAQSYDWIYKDGWYYYKHILEPGLNTNALMINVIFNIDSITKNYKTSSFNLDVDAQAVQSENNTTDILSVVGWPEQEEG